MKNLDLDIPILYEDNSCAVINKPSGLLTHGLNTSDGTPSIASWWKNRAGVSRNGWIKGREGIVHRLDRDTSGAMVLAKTPKDLIALQKLFHDRKITKTYLALVFGTPPQKQGRITSVVTRDKKHRTKRTSRLINFSQAKSQKAVSNYKVLDKINIQSISVSAVEFMIETGRTHQVRLHARSLGTPILGDADYGTKPSQRASKLINITRQMLHAKELKFISLPTNKLLDIKAPVPLDMKRILNE